MKQRTLAAIGCIVTAMLMICMAYVVMLYTDNPEDPALMAGLGMLSGGMMAFLVIFGLLYNKNPGSADMYNEIYNGICARCGHRFVDDVCPNCGRVKPRR